jgi:hypothetical protein
MADDPLEFLPGYMSPVTDKHHAIIGRIAILWGQVEHFVEQLLPTVTGLSEEELGVLQVSSKTIASKVDFLNAASKRIADEGVRKEIQAFCKIIHETKGQRNHVFHGMWGWRGDDRTKRVFAAAYKQSDKDAPFAASQLSRLEKKLCKCSRMGFDLFTRYVMKRPERPHPSRFFHHNTEDAFEGWLGQWSEHNPLDHDDPDRIEQAGQLPRRVRLYPERSPAGA